MGAGRTCLAALATSSPMSSRSMFRSVMTASYLWPLASAVMAMYHFSPGTALGELTEEAVLPNPVHMRDMLLRSQLKPDQSIELNRHFLEYQRHFAEAQKLGRDILRQLSKLHV